MYLPRKDLSQVSSSRLRLESKVEIALKSRMWTVEIKAYSDKWMILLQVMVNLSREAGNRIGGAYSLEEKI